MGHIYIIAPIICIGCYGHIIRVNGNLAVNWVMAGDIINGGVLRAFAGISLGGICYALSEKLASLDLTKLAKWLLTVVEITMYALAILLMRSQNYFRPDQIVVMCFAVAVTISFSNTTYTGRVFIGNPMWMGKLATCIYLADSPARYLIMKLTSGLGRDDRIVPALISTLVIALVIWCLGDLMLAVIKTIKPKMRKLFIRL